MTKQFVQLASRRFARALGVTVMAGALVLGTMSEGALSAPIHPMASPAQQLGDVEHVQMHRGGGGARRGGPNIGPRGNAFAGRHGPVGRPGFRPGGRPGFGPGARWARPRSYRWGPGGAIAAGAALGFVAAAGAAAFAASAAPAPGMCWFYTDPSRTQGFWDYCPQ